MGLLGLEAAWVGGVACRCTMETLWKFHKSLHAQRTGLAFAVKIRVGGPLRIVAWPTWSGRERSSHSHFLQVP